MVLHFFIVRHRDLDTLTISLKGNQVPYIFFAPGLWLRRTLGEGCLRPNIACAESKLVRPHTPPACMFNRLRHIWLASTLGQVIRLDLVSAQAKVSPCNIASRLVISIPIDRVHMSWCHSERRHRPDATSIVDID